MTVFYLALLSLGSPVLSTIGRLRAQGFVSLSNQTTDEGIRGLVPLYCMPPIHAEELHRMTVVNKTFTSGLWSRGPGFSSPRLFPTLNVSFPFATGRFFLFLTFSKRPLLAVVIPSVRNCARAVVSADLLRVHWVPPVLPVYESPYLGGSRPSHFGFASLDRPELRSQPARR